MDNSDKLDSKREVNDMFNCVVLQTEGERDAAASCTLTCRLSLACSHRSPAIVSLSIPVLTCSTYAIMFVFLLLVVVKVFHIC